MESRFAMTVTTLDQVRPITQTSNAVRFGAGVAFSLMSTVLLVLAFPPYNVWPLAFFAFVPTFIAEYHFLPVRWSGLGSAISVGGWLAIFLSAAFGGGKYVWIFLGIAWWACLASSRYRPSASSMSGLNSAGSSCKARWIMPGWR
jgi:apolipoprotein N-acyltransferase